MQGEEGSTGSKGDELNWHGAATLSGWLGKRDIGRSAGMKGHVFRPKGRCDTSV